MSANHIIRIIPQLLKINNRHLNRVFFLLNQLGMKSTLRKCISGSLGDQTKTTETAAGRITSITDGRGPSKGLKISQNCCQGCRCFKEIESLLAQKACLD